MTRFVRLELVASVAFHGKAVLCPPGVFCSDPHFGDWGCGNPVPKQVDHGSLDLGGAIPKELW